MTIRWENEPDPDMPDDPESSAVLEITVNGRTTRVTGWLALGKMFGPVLVFGFCLGLVVATALWMAR